MDLLLLLFLVSVPFALIAFGIACLRISAAVKDAAKTADFFLEYVFVHRMRNREKSGD